VRAALLADVVDDHDVRVRERGRGAGLGLEAVHEVAVGREPRGEHLERHRASQALLHGQVDRAHRALPDQALDAVAADLGRDVARARAPDGRRGRVRRAHLEAP
jgi:hypothetical protein